MTTWTDHGAYHIGRATNHTAKIETMVGTPHGKYLWTVHKADSLQQLRGMTAGTRQGNADTLEEAKKRVEKAARDMGAT